MFCQEENKLLINNRVEITKNIFIGKAKIFMRKKMMYKTILFIIIFYMSLYKITGVFLCLIINLKKLFTRWIAKE